MVDKHNNGWKKLINFVDEKIKAQAPVERMTLLPESFQPNSWTVICGRKRGCYDSGKVVSSMSSGRLSSYSLSYESPTHQRLFMPLPLPNLQWEIEDFESLWYVELEKFEHQNLPLVTDVFIKRVMLIFKTRSYSNSTLTL